MKVGETQRRKKKMTKEALEKGDKMKIDSLSAGEKRVYDFMKENGGITTLEALIEKR